MKKTEQQQQATAHQLWVRLGSELLTAVLYPEKIRKGPSFFNSSRQSQLDRCNQALSVLEWFETTRLRLYVDGIKEMGEATTRRRHEIEAEHAITPIYKFWKKRSLVRQHKEQLILENAYKRAIQVLTNTLPPAVDIVDTSQPHNGKPVMQVNVDTEEIDQKIDQKIDQVKEAVDALDEAMKQAICESCQGSGYAGKTHMTAQPVLCPVCHGTGAKPEEGADHA